MKSCWCRRRWPGKERQASTSSVPLTTQFQSVTKGLTMVPNVSVKVWGEFALFTRPDLKVERLSYPIMTPSAARGILDAILFKPQMYWHVRRITAIDPWWLPDESARPP